MLKHYLNLFMNGLGLFCQSYILFAVGNIMDIFKIIYPNCFLYRNCSEWIVKSISYSSVLGTFAGMLTIGVVIVQLFGRKTGMIMNICFILIGTLGMASAFGSS